MDCEYVTKLEIYDKEREGEALQRTFPPGSLQMSSHTKLAPHSCHAKIIIVVISMR